jgi:hypothetical protein
MASTSNGGWLIIGCRDRDDARALAARLRTERDTAKVGGGVAPDYRVLGLVKGRRPRLRPSGRHSEGTRRGSG